MSVNYAIIENEHFALEHLKITLQKIRPTYKLVFTGESVADTINFLKKKPALDFMLMDVELVDGSCFDIFSAIVVDVPIIFTTAYNQFAIEAFKVNSVGYILKPVSEDAVLEAVQKLEKLKDLHSETIANQNKLSFFEKKQFKNRILISKTDSYSFLYAQEIACFLSEDKYIFSFNFSNKRSLTSYTNLNQVEKEFDPAQFFRVSRSLIVNLEAISSVNKYFSGRLLVHLVPSVKLKEKVLVSAARKEDFLNWLGGNFS